MPETADRNDGQRAVIDIGSNSVRLVIYGGSLRAAQPVFNEKVLCELGDRDPDTGDLKPQAMDRAVAVLSRYRLILDQRGIRKPAVFATAAMREAPNAPKFLKRINSEAGLHPQVISGEEEARFSALGIFSAIPETVAPVKSGRLNLAGDLGGGSLELARYTDDSLTPLREVASLPLGVLRIRSRFGDNVKKAEMYVRKELAGLTWLGDPQTDNLYVVGGTWRAIARIHMNRYDAAYRALHHYEMRRDTALDICRLIEKSSQASILSMKGVQRSRAHTLPQAALVLRLLIEESSARKVILSSSGVREGVLFDRLHPADKQKDPLLSLARYYARQFCPFPDYGTAAFDVIRDLLSADDERRCRLALAACLLCDVAASQHPDHRAGFASRLALTAPFTGTDRPGRVFLAAVLYARYRGKPGALPEDFPAETMGEEDQFLADQLGLALKFLCDFLPGAAEPLSGCRLSRKGKDLIFEAPAGLAGLAGENPWRRLGALAVHAGCSPSMVFGGKVSQPPQD